MSQAIIIINWLICICTGCLLLFAVKQHRYLLVKPSILFVVYNYIFIQFPGAIYAGYAGEFLPNVLDYCLMSQVVPFSVLLISLLTYQSTAGQVWSDIVNNPFRLDRMTSLVYVGLTLAITIVYISYVGFTNTGFYAVLFNPANADVAREKSFTLVDSALIRYLYSTMSTSIVPVVTVAFMLQFWRNKQRMTSYLCWLVILFGFFAISLPGHRWATMLLCGTIFLALNYQNGYSRFNLWKVISFGMLLFGLMLAHTLLRQAHAEWSDVWRYLFSTQYFIYGEEADGGLVWAVIYRVIFAPMKAGWNYTLYVCGHGYWGVGGIPKLAALVGVKPIDVANLMCGYFFPHLPSSNTYPTGFIFAYYSFFGPWSLVVSVVLVCSLDAIVYLYRQLGLGLRIPVVSTISMAVISLTYTGFTTALVTDGILLSILLALLVQKAVKFAPVGSLRTVLVKILT